MKRNETHLCKIKIKNKALPTSILCPNKGKVEECRQKGRRLDSEFGMQRNKWKNF